MKKSLKIFKIGDLTAILRQVIIKTIYFDELKCEIQFEGQGEVMTVAAVGTVWRPEYNDALMGQESSLPRERLSRLGHTKQEKRVQIIAAYGLLRYGLHHIYSMSEIPKIAYDSYGKPFFEKYPDIHFNLSHADGAALCAIGDASVGVDIERIRAVTQKRAMRLRLPEAPDAFFAQWVSRECIVKYRGESALLCRKPIFPGQQEQYEVLSMGDEYAAGICAAVNLQLSFEMLPIEGLLEFLEHENSIFDA